MLVETIIFAVDIKNDFLPGADFGAGFALVIVAAIFSVAAGTLLVLIAKEPLVIFTSYKFDFNKH